MIPGQLERMKEVYSGRAQIGAKLETPIRLRPKIGRARYELGFLLRRIGATISRLGFYLSYGQYLVCGRNASRKRIYIPPLLDPEVTNQALASAYGMERNTMCKLRVRVREMVYKKLDAR